MPRWCLSPLAAQRTGFDAVPEFSPEAALVFRRACSLMVSFKTEFVCSVDTICSELLLSTSFSSPWAGMFSWKGASGPCQMSPSGSSCGHEDVTTLHYFSGLLLIPRGSDSRAVCGKPSRSVKCKQFAVFALICSDGFYPKMTQQHFAQMLLPAERQQQPQGSNFSTTAYKSSILLWYQQKRQGVSTSFPSSGPCCSLAHIPLKPV